jgi:hypothetical protein
VGTEFDEQKIILAQGERQLLRRHVKQYQQLLVRNEVPIAANDRDVTATAPVR